MAIRDCTDPTEVLTDVPCLNCLQIHHLWVALVGLLANGNGEAGDIPAIKENASKYRNLTDKQFLIGLIAALPDSFWEGITADNVAQDFGCMTCWSDAELKAAFLVQWCTYWQSVQQ